MNSDLNNEYWSSRYTSGSTGWDIGYASTPLVHYFDQINDKDIAILIPGCGNAYEASYLINNGFNNITLVDISTVLTDQLKKEFATELNKSIKILNEDFFSLTGQYDLIIEQTFFCAIDPSLRKQYAQKVHELLKPGGRVVGVLFNRNFEGGPPFGGSIDAYEDLFQPYFSIHTLEECYNSIAPRKGAEVFINLIKK